MLFSARQKTKQNFVRVNMKERRGELIWKYISLVSLLLSDPLRQAVCIHYVITSDQRSFSFSQWRPGKHRTNEVWFIHCARAALSPIPSAYFSKVNNLKKKAPKHFDIMQWVINYCHSLLSYRLKKIFLRSSDSCIIVVCNAMWKTCWYKTYSTIVCSSTFRNIIIISSWCSLW